METVLHYPQDFLLGAIGMLDALPDSVRAILAAILLVVFLRIFESRIPRHEIQYGQSFRKTALVALMVIPLFVWLFPASRMIVFVEELIPTDAGMHWFWIGVLTIWLTGMVISVAALIRCHLSAHAEMMRFKTVSDDKLSARLDHWQRRLGIDGTLQLVEVPGDQPRFLSSGARIAMPSAALHWPGTLQDILLIVSLSHLKRRHRRWHLFGQLVSSAYWPLPWTRMLHAHLLHDFQQSADELAESCYQDRMGYSRALRQLEARLSAPVNVRGSPHEPKVQTNHYQAARAGLLSYTASLRTLLDPLAEPGWRLDELLTERGTDAKLLWTDPYDKVVLFVGQAVFLAFLLTGVTLRERPPELDYEYTIPFELLWKEHFHRNQELLDKTQPNPG